MAARKKSAKKKIAKKMAKKIVKKKASVAKMAATKKKTAKTVKQAAGGRVAAKNVFVCLLRGINVGGNNKVDMKLLKKTCERIGLQSVTTYINSGNVVFIDEKRSKSELVGVLEQAIEKNFKLKLKVVVRDGNDFQAVARALPDTWQNDDQMKSDVMFLWDDVDRRSVLKDLPIKPEFDTVKYVSGAVLWRVDRENVTRSGLMKLAGDPLYKKMTIRNVNTTRKIFELMNAAGSG